MFYVCDRLSSLCHAFSLFTSPFFVSLELVVFPLFLNKILDVSFEVKAPRYIFMQQGPYFLTEAAFSRSTGQVINSFSVVKIVNFIGKKRSRS